MLDNRNPNITWKVAIICSAPPGIAGAKIGSMISKELLDILVCPACKKPLTMKENGESLKCGACRRVYPIKDDIPILLIDEAVTEPS